ncbi:MAG: class I SAM-dependent methyltransferase [Alphaproteobacteria bacterium]
MTHGSRGPGARARWRTLAFGVATLLGRPRGFFLPHRYADAIAPPRTYPELEEPFRLAEPAFHELFDRIDGYGADLRAIGGGPPPQPRWDQDWFPRLDAAPAYALVRATRPGRIVEVGSGHSTRFLARAVRDGDLATALVTVDPAPRAGIDGLGADVRRTTLQAALAGADDPFRFAPGDILFIDSSHLLMPGSDVDLLLTRLLPRLPPGGILHVHDVFLPDAYPRAWSWRGYNEQNALAPLLCGAGFEILFASRWAATRMADRLARSALAALPIPPGAWETSLWLRRGPA